MECTSLAFIKNLYYYYRRSSSPMPVQYNTVHRPKYLRPFSTAKRI